MGDRPSSWARLHSENESQATDCSKAVGERNLERPRGSRFESDRFPVDGFRRQRPPRVLPPHRMSQDQETEPILTPE